MTPPGRFRILHPGRMALLPGLVLALGLGATVGLWRVQHADAEQRIYDRLQFQADKLGLIVAERVALHVQILKAVAALFEASDHVNRAEFRRYVDSMGFIDQHPGIRAVGFVQPVQADRIAEHVAAIRAEGVLDYRIWPLVSHSTVAPIVYVEPMMGANRGVLGFDALSEPVRAKALMQARVTEAPVLSEKIILLQEGGFASISGFLIVAPLVESGSGASGGDRNAGFFGWVYLANRMQDIMTHALEDWEVDRSQGALDVSVYDGQEPLPDRLLFSTRGMDAPTSVASAFQVVQRIDPGGRHWLIEVAPIQADVHAAIRRAARPVALIGCAVSVLLSLLIGVLILSQQRVVRAWIEADRANAELTLRARGTALGAARRADGQLELRRGKRARALVRRSVHTLCARSERGRAPYARHPQLFGEDWPRLDQAVQAALRDGTPYQLDLSFRRFDGEMRVMVVKREPQLNAAGRVTGLVGTVQDITERRRLQDVLREQAVRDPLTGLFNRRYLDETLPQEIARIQRTGEPLAIAMLDLDNFKAFNDSFGHEAGDDALRAIGALLLRSLRAGDIACRYGGEEFTLIFPAATAETLIARLEGIRRACMDLRLTCRGQDLTAIRVSIGLATVASTGIDSARALAMADAALYRAKRQGRNRVVIAEESEGTAAARMSEKDQDGQIVADAAREHEQVPDSVRPREAAVHGVEDDAEGVEEAAGNETPNACRG